MKKAVLLLIFLFIGSIIYPVSGEPVSKMQGSNTPEMATAGIDKHARKAKPQKSRKKKTVNHKKAKKHAAKPAKTKSHKKK